MRTYLLTHPCHGYKFVEMPLAFGRLYFTSCVMQVRFWEPALSVYDWYTHGNGVAAEVNKTEH